MELIFSFLPLPVTVVAIIVIGVGGLLIRKYSKSKAVNTITDAVVNGVMTRDRIDQTVEAVLAKLKVQTALADKIGDLIAGIIISIMDTRDVIASKAAIISQSVVQDKGITPAVASQLVAGPTLLNNLIVEVADADVAGSVDARALVAEGVIKAYADKRVL